MKSFWGVITLLLHSVFEVRAVPAPAPSPGPQSSNGARTACANLGIQQANTRPVQGWYYLQPSLALSCLRSIPIDYDLAAELTQYLINTYQFQSTLSYLKNPPSTYPWPATDILAGLSTILDDVRAETYGNQWDFELAIHRLLSSGRDGHLSFSSSLTAWFVMVRPALVSISLDGTSLPEVYFLNDVFAARNGAPLPSPITSIGGSQNLSQYLSNPDTTWSLSQDSDAQYNVEMFNPANYWANSIGNAHQLSWSLDFNDTVEYTFANGSTSNIDHFFATFLQIPATTTPQQLFNRLVRGSSSNSKLKRQTTPEFTVVPPDSATVVFQPSDLGYPIPVVNSTDGVFTGYFLEDHPDTAVMMVYSFSPINGIGNPWDFQDSVTDFFDQCRRSGKTKLIIDVRGNGGGIPNLAYDLYKQLFPSEQIWTKLRMRVHPAAHALGKVLTELSFPTLQQVIFARPGVSSEYYQSVSQVFDAKVDLEYPEGPAYNEWDKVYGPQNINGDQFTNYFSVDFSNIVVNQQNGGIQVFGSTNMTVIPPQPFSASNITLLTDGGCASSCAIFSNLMIQRGNVSSLVMGGRPSTNKMAIIGGVEGGQLVDHPALMAYVQTALRNLDLVDNLEPDELQALRDLNNEPGVNWDRGYNARFNFLDNLLDDGNDTPPQFRPTMSNCRAFYTASDIYDIQSTWTKIASGNFTCIDGGQKPGEQILEGSGNVQPNSATKSQLSIIGIIIALIVSICFT